MKYLIVIATLAITLVSSEVYFQDKFPDGKISIFFFFYTLMKLFVIFYLIELLIIFFLYRVVGREMGLFRASR